MTRRVRRIVFDLLAQALDQRVDAAHGDERVVLPHRRSSASRLKTMPGIREQHVQQLELLRGQLDVLPPTVTRRRAGSICDVLVASGARRRLTLARSARRPAPQQRAHARHQLADAERLGQVVVGAAVEAEHLVGLLAAGREHQDRRVGVRRVAPDGAAQREAVEPGQHQVEDDQVELAARAPARGRRRRRPPRRASICSSFRCRLTSSRMLVSSSTTRTRRRARRRCSISEAFDSVASGVLSTSTLPFHPKAWIGGDPVVTKRVAADGH